MISGLMVIGNSYHHSSNWYDESWCEGEQIQCNQQCQCEARPDKNGAPSNISSSWHMLCPSSSCVACHCDHENVCYEDPHNIWLLEDELQNKADDWELYDASDDGDCHLLLNPKLLVVWHNNCPCYCHYYCQKRFQHSNWIISPYLVPVSSHWLLAQWAKTSVVAHHQWKPLVGPSPKWIELSRYKFW